ncbi:hypothetical protein FD723_27170 [Nostoc sp. C052]|uniref:hypothetical protein n=1 Tax=Nostoc sp. C052 TaxID=2576902 RepID=UPI0015C3BF15|nr:hypothetical protein [Nostoc sp. C052]QLE43758.1 hypothetical protein FD723_27170 [Nostoc sp. C052]
MFWIQTLFAVERAPPTTFYIKLLLSSYSKQVPLVGTSLCDRLINLQTHQTNNCRINYHVR